jgi:thiosulfate/3-mercaptopyruvate sulfurtransferase
MRPDIGPLVCVDELAGGLGEPDLVILDASWHMPAEARDARAEFAAVHMPGARFFDLDQISDHASSLPHMLPSPSEFARAVRRLGVSNDSRVVVYDSAGLFSAPRVWWSFRAMGHPRVHVLDGGLPAWTSAGRPLESGWPEAPHGDFKAHPLPELVADLDYVRRALESGAAQVVDARPAARFRGEAPEPRPGLRNGHMPGARSAPYASLLSADGVLLPPQKLKAAFEGAGIDLERPIITTCGSGVTAALLALALARLGRWDASVYDGSWAEWAARSDTSVAPGPPA